MAPIADRPNLRRLGVVITAAALVVAGCGEDDDASGDTIDSVETVSTDERPPDTEAAPVTEPAPTDPPATDPPATEPPSTEPPATEPPAATTSTTSTTIALGGSSSGGSSVPATDAPPASDPPPATDAPPPTSDSGGSADCLIGNWVITLDEMNAYYDALEVALDAPGFDITITSGAVGLVMGPDTYEYSANFALDVSVSGTAGSGQTSGAVSGAWSSDGEIISAETGASNLNITMTVAGVTIDGSEFGNDLLTSNPIHEAPFDCAGPTIDFQTGVGTPRHPVTLTPA